MKYICIAWLFIACNIGPKNQLKISTEKLDTIKTIATQPVTAPLLFETAFVKGTSEKINNSRIRLTNKDVSLYGVNIGKLKISSGRIIACDPLHIDEYGIPFTQLFPTGEFPVQLSIALLDDEESIAFMRINFSDEPVVKWEMALQKGQSALPIGSDDIHGFAVDAGIAIFLDEEASKELNKELVMQMQGPFYDELNKHYRYKWKYAMYNFGRHNMVGFTTGMGDGRYASYIGFDASGKPCRLVTDFGFFNWRNN